MERDRKKLGTYRDKRAPGITNEPFGEESGGNTRDTSKTESGAFVIHLHDATRRHYDVRLEVGGVLLSFAVPKGPSLDPQEKVLAVRTEEHPIEYLEFEDVIPSGQYGAGPMIAWDRGLVNYIEGPAENELAQGKLHVELRGMKLRGRWAFIRLAKSETGNEWLLFKKQDESADPSRKIIDELPRSVFSGLTVDELDQRESIAAAHVDRALKFGAPRNDALVTELSTQKESPLLPGSGEGAATTALYDPELDGVRVLALRDGDVVTLRAFTGDAVERIEAFYPDVVRALRALVVTRLAIDGELVAFDPASGHPSLALLAQRASRVSKGEAHRAMTTTPVVLVARDLLVLGDADTRALPIEQRRELLSSLLPSLGYVRTTAALEGDEKRVLATCASLGITSVMAKAKGSLYDARGGSNNKNKSASPSPPPSPPPSPWRHLSTGLAPRSRTVVNHKALDARTALRRVTVTNRDKVFWPEDLEAKPKPLPKYTKGDLVDYYGSIADVVLPYLKDRPVILVRYPDGIDGKSFFQWNVPVGMPPWIRTMTMHELEDYRAVPHRGGDVPHTQSRPPPNRSRGGGARPSSPPSSGATSNQNQNQKTPKRVFLVDDASTLVYIANLGCIPLHVLASRAPDLTKADFLTIDFDVKQSELRHAVTLACTLHEILDAIGLPGFPKTSGQTGLHVLVPLGSQTFDTARALADLLGRLLVNRHPNIATMDRVVSRRGDKVYVDTGQTGSSRAIVAPYSVRAVRGAQVSTPLHWDEVTKKLNPRAFTIKTVPERIAKHGDLFKGLLGGQPNVPRAVTRLADLVPSTE